MSIPAAKKTKAAKQMKNSFLTAIPTQVNFAKMLNLKYISSLNKFKTKNTK